jgi:hypothetical protein
MCCTTLMIQEAAMATTQVARTIWKEISPERQEEHLLECRPVRMNWVVVTDDKGSRQLRIRWQPTEG